MSEDRYQLDLTGRPLEGYQTEEAAASLARLLRISRKRARSLLRGTPSRIKRQLEKDKAIHLMGKVIACGVQCKITQADMLDDNPAVEAGIELQDKLELEIEQPEIELAGEAAEAEMQSQNDAVGGDRIPAQSVSPKVQAPPEVSTADESSEDQPSQSPSAGTIKRGSSASTVSIGGGRQRKLLFAVAALAVLGLATWISLRFVGGSAPPPRKASAEKSHTEKMSAKATSKTSETKRRLEMMTRSVRIWMIQYGAGFDPTQVTLSRMQQDLEISQAEMEDSWGSVFQYSTSDGYYTITSAGPDRIFGNEDDIKAKKSAR